MEQGASVRLAEAAASRRSVAAATEAVPSVVAAMVGVHLAVVAIRSAEAVVVAAVAVVAADVERLLDSLLECSVKDDRFESVSRGFSKNDIRPGWMNAFPGHNLRSNAMELGQLLVNDGLISREQLNAARETQGSLRIDQALVKLGVITEDAILRKP